MHSTDRTQRRAGLFARRNKTAVPPGREATIDRIVAVLTHKFGRVPSDREVASILAISVEGVSRLRVKQRGAESLSNVRILDFTAHNSGALVGFANVEFASGMQMYGVTILQGKDGRCALPPGRPQLDATGRARRKANGKVEYAPIIKFRSRDIQGQWSSQIIEELQRTCGSLLT
jgi:hypothetical protein